MESIGLCHSSDVAVSVYHESSPVGGQARITLLSMGRWRSWLSHLSNMLFTEGPQFEPGPTHILLVDLRWLRRM